MKDQRKKEIKTMADGIESRSLAMTANDKFAPGEIPNDIQRKKLKTAAEIIATKKLEIPKCLSTPVNGRIYVLQIAGSETKTVAGIILPHKLNIKKNDEVIDYPRYFCIAWDKDEIPQKLQEKLTVGLELNPFVPEDAIGFSFPKIIDWQTGNTFQVIHYTELGGVSSVLPEVVEK
jgi:hypothetical protein